jgi:hypothetical protein
MANELECGITTEIEEHDKYAADPHIDSLEISNWNFCFPTPHPWYSQWTERQ